MRNLFASRLSGSLKEYNLSKRKLEKAVGVSATSISDWTNGKIQPTAESIFIIAQYFDVSSDYLLGLEDETGAKNINNMP